MTPKGILLNPTKLKQPETVDPEKEYEIDYVSHAEKVGGRYQVWIKWKGFEELTYEWRSDLLAQGLSDELVKEVEKAVEKERVRLAAKHYMHDDDTIGEPPEPQADPEPEPVPEDSQGRSRRRKAPSAGFYDERRQARSRSLAVFADGEDLTYGKQAYDVMSMKLMMMRGEGACAEDEY